MGTYETGFLEAAVDCCLVAVEQPGNLRDGAPLPPQGFHGARCDTFFLPAAYFDMLILYLPPTALVALADEDAFELCGEREAAQERPSLQGVIIQLCAGLGKVDVHFLLHEGLGELVDLLDAPSQARDFEHADGLEFPGCRVLHHKLDLLTLTLEAALRVVLVE